MDMSRPKAFHEAFWGSDFCSSAGFDALRKRMRDGRATCKTYAEHLKLRAKAEDDFGKALVRSCKMNPEPAESGSTLRAAVDCLRAKTEEMAQAHIELGSNLLVAASRMTDFMARQKAAIKMREDLVSQSIKNKVALYRSVVDAKRQYELRSQEFETADIAHERALNDQNNYTTKDYDKIIATAKKAKLEFERAQKAYEDLVRRLDVARVEWEQQMTEFCKLCEQQEQARIKMLQNEMWVCCNMNSACCVEVDQEAEEVRQKLEVVDINADLQSFISSSGTGRERPAPIRFEEYRPQFHPPSHSSNPAPSNPPRPPPPDGALLPPNYYGAARDISAPRSVDRSQTMANGQRAPQHGQPVQVMNRNYRHN